MEPGGRADKLGNRFEGTWVALQLLHVLAGSLKSVEIEPLGEAEEGVDLWVVYADGQQEAQQCKRGNASKGSWSVADLRSRGVLRHLRDQLRRDSSFRYAFISGDPAPDFRGLCERAQGAGGDSRRFFSVQVQATQGPRKSHHQFCTALGLDPQNPEHRDEAFDLLTRSSAEVFPPGRSGESLPLSLARLLFEGEPSQGLAVLRDLISESTSWARPLTDEWLSKRLKVSGVRRRDLAADASLAVRIEALCSEFDESLAPELIADDLLRRVPADRVAAVLQEERGARIVAILGDAGSGKSCVLLSVLRDLRARGVRCLPIRLDARMPSISARRFGIDGCDLPESPGLCLHALAGERPAVLILDQLDAIRWTSGHGPAAWEACKEVIQDALAFDNIRVVVACRGFDWETDPQVRAWVKGQDCEEIRVPPLDEDELRERIATLGGNYDALSRVQRRVLSSPLGLSLWSKLGADGARPRDFSTASDLLRAFWHDRLSKLEELGVPGAHALEAIGRLIDFMSAQERLDAPESILGAEGRVGEALLALGILARGGRRLRFAHQSYFDYQVARRAIDSAHAGRATFAGWLLEKEQTLFRREQLRLGLELLREEDPREFLEGIDAILGHDRVRFHFKHLALQVLGSAAQPSDREVELVLRYLAREEWTAHIEELVLLRSAGWLDALDERGSLAQWLGSGSKEAEDRALWICRRFAGERGDRVARALKELENEPSPWPERVANAVAFTDAHDSREMFELQLRALARGEISRFSIAWRKLAEFRPEWCVEALEVAVRSTAAHLTADDTSDSVFGERTGRGELVGLDGVEFDVVRKAAPTHSSVVWRRLVPAIAELAAAGQVGEGDGTTFVEDRIWGDGLHRTRPDSAEAMLEAVACACGGLANVDFRQFETQVRQLATSDLLTCQRLVAMILAAAPERAADLAYRWLVSDRRRFRFGSSAYERSWRFSSEILSKFGQACSDAAVEGAERVLLTYRDPEEWADAKWAAEARRSGELKRLGNSVGRAAYVLLSAMPIGRLSDRAKRKLQVLDRKFGSVTKCLIAEDGTSAVWVGPNLPHEVARRMTDRAWLDLIARETARATEGAAERRVRPRMGFKEHVGILDAAIALDEAARREPVRFAKLSLRFPPSTPSRILGSVLEGCKQHSCPTEGSDSKPVMENWAPAPADLIESVLDRWETIENREAAGRLCRLIAERPEAVWSDRVIAKLVWCATEHPDPDPTSLPVSRPGDSVEDASAETLRHGAINCVRGQAALAIEQLLFADPKRLRRLRPAIEKLVADPSPVVRCAAIGVCVPILNVDRQLAVNLFLRAVSGTHPSILAVHDAERFLRFSVYHRLPGAVSVARRMTSCSKEEIVRAGVHRAVAFVLHHPRTPAPFSRTARVGWRLIADRLLVPIADAWIRRADRNRPFDDLTVYAQLGPRESAREEVALYNAGLRSVAGSEAQRQAAAEVAASAAQHPEYFSYCASIIRRLVDDECKDVRRAAMQVFRLDDLMANEGASRLMRDVVASRAFRDGPFPLLWALKGLSRLADHSGAVLDVCDTFAGDLADESRDGRTGIAGDSGTVSELLLRLYGEAADASASDLRSACLDRWDRLLQARVGRADEALQRIDSG